MMRGEPLSDGPAEGQPHDVDGVESECVEQRDDVAAEVVHRVRAVDDRRLAVPAVVHGDDVRERSMQSAWLERFSESAGGSLFRVERDAGEEAWRRILDETSAYYLLGVEPAAEDRGGRPHALRVKVKRGASTVRSRSWVVIP